MGIKGIYNRLSQKFDNHLTINKLCFDTSFSIKSLALATFFSSSLYSEYSASNFASG